MLSSNSIPQRVYSNHGSDTDDKAFDGEMFEVNTLTGTLFNSLVDYIDAMSLHGDDFCLVCIIIESYERVLNNDKATASCQSTSRYPVSERSERVTTTHVLLVQTLISIHAYHRHFQVNERGSISRRPKMLPKTASYQFLNSSPNEETWRQKSSRYACNHSDNLNEHVYCGG